MVNTTGFIAIANHNSAHKIQYIINDNSVTAYHQLVENLTKSVADISFNLDSFLSDKQTHKGQLPPFVELVSFATSERQGELAIASNTPGQIVVLKAP